MKKVYIIIFVCLLSLSGCNELLDNKPYSIITSDNMWSTESEVKAGAVGMYDQFRTTFNDYDFLIYFELRSGFWQVGKSGGAQWDDLFMNTPNASSTPSLDWSSMYKLINSANLVLKYAPLTKFSNQDDASNLLADAYFIRAYTYFALVRIFGEVPISILPYESYDDENLFPSRKSVSEVFTLIKSDIENALSNIKDKSVRDRIKPSEAAINMLKADVYLWTAKRLQGGKPDFQIAQAAADLVLKNPNYSLLGNYQDVFRIEQNNEIILSIYFDKLEKNNQYGIRFLYQTSQVEAALRNSPIPVGSNAQWLTFNDHYINTYLLKTAGDTRSAINCQNYINGKNKYRWINKYLGEWINETRENTSDTRLYRFAEAILFNAEALNGIDQTSLAIIELNKIAKRAYGKDNFYASNMTKDAVDQAILTERLIEFGAEGKSWMDFVRFGKAFTLIPTLVGKENNNAGNILLLPVAISTLSKNPNIKQTPGFE